jgi:hypothetical protein
MKTFFQFMEATKGDGGSPYEVYKPNKPSNPGPPPPGFDIKDYLKNLPVKKASVKEDAGSGYSKMYQNERMQRRRTAAQKRNDPDLAKLTYLLNKDLPR